MSLHVVVGAGPVGSAIACLLAGRGDQVPAGHPQRERP